MDADELRAAHAEAKARSRVLLDPDAYRAQQAEERGTDVVQRRAPPVVVEHRTYDGIGWSPPPLMPCEFVEILPPLPKPKPLTAAEIGALVDRRVAALVAQHREVEADVIGAVVSHERKRHAVELARLELGFDARLHALSKRQTIAADIERREAEVINLLRRRRSA